MEMRENMSNQRRFLGWRRKCITLKMPADTLTHKRAAANGTLSHGIFNYPPRFPDKKPAVEERGPPPYGYDILTLACNNKGLF